LLKKKRTLEKNIYELERQLQDDVDDIQILDARLKKISSDIAEMRPQQNKISKEYKELEKSAKILIDRDELEVRLSELEASVAARIEDIKGVKNIISECNELVPDLEKTVKSFQGRLGVLTKKAKDMEQLKNERESFKADNSVLEADLNNINLKVEELQREVETKEGALKKLSIANAGMKDSIEFIESYIAKSGQKVDEINSEKNKLRDSDRLNEDAISGMEDMFNNKIKMDNDLSRIGEAIKTIVRTIETAGEIKLT